MIYRSIGLMSGSSLDGLDIAFTEFEEVAGRWSFRLLHTECVAFDTELSNRLSNAQHLPARAYLKLHTDFGKFCGNAVNDFIKKYSLDHQAQLVASHGHTVFHAPEENFTAQLGCGATIAAITGINTVSDLRAMDMALGGQGAPIVPVGEKLLFQDYTFLLNIGGITNISYKNNDDYIAFDICPANRILNMIIQRAGKEFDENGNTAGSGTVHTALLTKLNQLDYYKLSYPKSLANQFGTETVLPLIDSFNLNNADALRTYVEHIVMQVQYVIMQLKKNAAPAKMLVTGGGAFNQFLTARIQSMCASLQVETIVPEKEIVSYKEALIMALLGVLRWREENTVLASVTGAKRNSIGGAVWIGQEA